MVTMKTLTYEMLKETVASMSNAPIRPMIYVLPFWVHRLTYLNMARTIQHRITNSKKIPNRFRVGCVLYVVAEEIYK